MIHIKIQNPELEKKIRESGGKYTDLVEKALDFYYRHKVVKVSMPDNSLNFIWLDLYHSHQPDCSVVKESNGNKSNLIRLGYLWQACAKFGLIGANPLVTSVNDFEVLLQQVIYNFCFVEKFDKDIFTEEHLYQLRNFLNHLTKPEMASVKWTLEKNLITYVGMGRAEEIVKTIFEEDLTLNKETLDQTWKDWFGGSVDIQNENEDDK